MQFRQTEFKFFNKCHSYPRTNYYERIQSRDNKDLHCVNHVNFGHKPCTNYYYVYIYYA